MPIDYKTLLKKYMQHVFDMEGLTFVHLADCDGFFTQEEYEELSAMDDEVDD